MAWPATGRAVVSDTEVTGRTLAPAAGAATTNATSSAAVAPSKRVIGMQNSVARERRGKNARVLTSDDRILTTHAGSLPRPAALAELHGRRSRGESVDIDEF